MSGRGSNQVPCASEAGFFSTVPRGGQHIATHPILASYNRISIYDFLQCLSHFFLLFDPQPEKYEMFEIVVSKTNYLHSYALAKFPEEKIRKKVLLKVHKIPKCCIKIQLIN